MPKAAYVLFAESGAIDTDTNRLSLFDLIDIVEVVPRKPGEVASSPTKRRLPRAVAVWVREEDDNLGDVFEIQIACVAPDGTDYFASPVHRFSFSAPFHRLNIPAIDVTGYPATGLYLIESRLRKVGQTGWTVRQSYPFLVQVTPSSQPATGS